MNESSHRLFSLTTVAARRLVRGRQAIGRLPVGGLCVMAGGLLVAFAAGCSHQHVMRGFDDSCRVQVQFYEPGRAHVVMRRRPHGEYHADVAPSPEQQLEDGGEYAIFNLKPSKDPYPFAYSPDDGSNVNIYGELEVMQPESEFGQKFVAHGFVPISLLSSSEGTREVFYNPSRGNSGAGLSSLEMAHLSQGDMISRVYFVADLAVAEQTIRDIDAHVERLRSSETVLNTHLEWVDSRFQSYRRDSLYADPTSDTLARAKDKNGENHEFIRLEGERQRIENERYDIRRQIEDLLAEQRMRKRLLDTMRIVNRRGSLVLATPENQWDFYNTENQITIDRHYSGFTSGPLDAYKTGDITVAAMGEPLVVMNVGGRHRHWPEMTPPPPAHEIHGDDDMAWQAE